MAAMLAVVPALGGWTAAAGEPASAAGPLQDLGRQCRVLVQPVEQGGYISARMTAPAACHEGAGSTGGEAQVARLVRYDRDARAVVARIDLPAGTALGALALAEGAELIPAGTELRLQLRSGPVVIEREVRMLQPGRPGERVFVAGAGGEIFSAQIDEGVVP